MILTTLWWESEKLATEDCGRKVTIERDLKERRIDPEDTDRKVNNRQPEQHMQTPEGRAHGALSRLPRPTDTEVGVRSERSRLCSRGQNSCE